MSQIFPPTDNYEVMVQCCTYNQSNYIEDTLKGFAIQQTNFPFVCCVFDDASTDGEQEILKQWIENHCNLNEIKSYDHPIAIILMAPDKNNSNCIYAIHLQKVNTWGKPEKEEMIAHWEKQCNYVAICEGDDYWIDPLKLQKQTDILKSDNSFGLCYTKAMVYNQSSGEFENYLLGANFNDFDELLLANKIPTLTTLFKSELYQIYKRTINPNSRNWKMGDYPLWLWFCANSKIKFLEEETAVYRVLENSASHSDNYKKNEEFTSSTKDIRLFFHKLYSGNPLLKDKIFDSFYRENIDFGVKRNLRLYILENLKKIKYKNTRETIKYLFYQTKAGYYILNKIR